VIGIWLLLAVVCGGVLGGKLDKLTNAQVQSDQALPSGSQSAQVGQLLRDRFPGGQQFDALLVYARASGLTAADRARIATDASSLKTVADTAPPQAAFAPGSPPELVSRNGRVAITVVPLTTRDSAKRDAAVKQVRKLLGTGQNGLQVRLTGPVGFQSDFNTALSGADVGLLGATVLLVLVLLVITYKSPIAALIPLTVVGIAYAVARGLIYVYADATHTVVDRTALTLLAVLMFGAGTDYCLLLISRFTADLRAEPDSHVAMVGALSRTTHAILASGGTVIAAMLTFLLSSLSTNHILAPVNAIGIAVVMLAGVTLLPAVLAAVGRRGFWPNQKSVAVHEVASETGVRDAASAISENPSLWFRIATRVTRRPAIALVVALVALGAGAAGLLTFKEKVSVTDDFRSQNDSTRGLSLLRTGFPEGAIYPETVMIRRAGASVSPSDVALVRSRIISLPGVASVSGVNATSRDGSLETVSVVYSGDPFSDSSQALARRMREVVAHPAPGLTALVGEGTSARVDYRDAVNHDTRIIVPAVLAVITLTLIILLRALVAPLFLLATVVLSFAGSLGISVFITREILGQSLDAFYPLITFVFLVALGVDYNIFLMSRVREEAIEHGTRTGLLRALVATGPVITSAGLILAGTFSALTTLPLWILLEIGLTVAIGVLLDTFVVRTIAVPAIVRLLGEASWWPSSARAGRASRLTSGVFRVDSPRE
jgi:RND superfamily putative drug exporter